MCQNARPPPLVNRPVACSLRSGGLAFDGFGLCVLSLESILTSGAFHHRFFFDQQSNRLVECYKFQTGFRLISGISLWKKNPFEKNLSY